MRCSYRVRVAAAMPLDCAAEPDPARRDAARVEKLTPSRSSKYPLPWICPADEHVLKDKVGTATENLRWEKNGNGKNVPVCTACEADVAADQRKQQEEVAELEKLFGGE